MSFKVKIAFLIFPLITLFFANASVATQCRERPSTCNDSDLCIYAFTNQFTMWDMKYRGHVIEAKRRGYFPSSVPVYKYGCGAVKNKSVNVMRYYFTKLVRDDRG